MRSIPRMGTALAMLAATAILAVPASARQSKVAEAERIADRTQELAEEGAKQSGKVVQGRLPASDNQRMAQAAAGQWNSNCRLPDDFNLIHATVLRSGNLLAIAGSGNVPGGTRRGYVLNPDTCSFTQLSLPRDFFCSINVALPDGTVLMAGGTRQYDPFQGLRTAYVFNPGERTFTRAGTMAEGRWYPGATQLANGDVAVFSGLDTAGDLNPQVEIYRWQTRTWNLKPYTFNVPTYAHMLPMSGGRLFFTGMGFGGSNRVGILTPSNGAWQAVGGLDPSTRDQGASFFVPGTQGLKAMVVGGEVNTSATIDLSRSNPTYQAGPSLAKPTRFLSHGTLFDGTVLLAGGQDPAGNPVSDAYLYRPSSGTLEPAPATSYAHQYHSVMWVDRKGRAWLGGGNPARGVEQPVLERFDPWYVDEPNRPAFTSAPSTIKHNQEFSVTVRVAQGETLSRLWLHRPASVTHQFGAAEGSFSLARSGSRWVLRANGNLTPPGYYYLVATDSRGVPSVAKMVRVAL
jgi:Domain of unknown function (DUF1929)